MRYQLAGNDTKESPSLLLSAEFPKKTDFTNVEICVNGSIRLLEAIGTHGKYNFRVTVDVMVYII